MIEAVIMPSVHSLQIGIFTPTLSVFTLPLADWDLVIDSRRLASIVLKCLEKYKVDIDIGGVVISAATLDTIMSKTTVYREMLFEKQKVDNSKMEASIVQVFHSHTIQVECLRKTNMSFVFYIMTNSTQQFLVQANRQDEDHCFPFEEYQPAKAALIEENKDPATYFMKCLGAILLDNRDSFSNVELLEKEDGLATDFNNVKPELVHTTGHVEHQSAQEGEAHVWPTPGITSSLEDSDELQQYVSGLLQTLGKNDITNLEDRTVLDNRDSFSNVELLEKEDGLATDFNNVNPELVHTTGHVEHGITSSLEDSDELLQYVSGLLQTFGKNDITNLEDRTDVSNATGEALNWGIDEKFLALIQHDISCMDTQ